MTIALTTRIEPQTPASLDQELRSLALSLNVKLSVGKRLKPKYDDRCVFLGNDLEAVPTIASGEPADLARFAEAVADKLTPAPLADIEHWIAELSMIAPIAPSRAVDRASITLMLEAYSRRLENYPADMVHYALLVKAWRFFPSWFELKQDLDEMRQARTAMLDACRPSNPTRSAPPEEKRERVSAERAAEILAEVGFKMSVTSASETK